MHVLHLLNLRQDGDEPVLACRAALNVGDVEHRVIGLGSAADGDRAERLGVLIDDLVTPPGPAAEFGARRLRRLLAERDGRGAIRPWADLVQCWSMGTLGLARLIYGSRTPPRAGALMRPPSPRAGASSLGLARARYALHYATLFAFDRAVRAAWAGPASARRGGDLLEQNIRILQSPHRSGDRLTEESRERDRARLGFEREDVVVALLADPPPAADCQRFAFILGLMHTTGRRVAGLVPGGAGHLTRARRFVRLHGSAWGLRSCPIPMLDALNACDFAVWDAVGAGGGQDGSCGVPMLRSAMAAGLPIAAGRHPTSEAALGSACPGQLARDGSRNAIADSLARLLNDPALARQVSQANLAAAATRGSFEHDLLRLWQEMANVPICRPGFPVPPSLVAAGGAA